MTTKTEREYETVERRNTVLECDFSSCYKTDKDGTVFELPLERDDGDEKTILHICADCLATYFATEENVDFDSIESVEETFRTGVQVNVIQKKETPKSVGLAIAGIPLFAVLVFNALILMFHNPSIITWGLLAFISAFMYFVFAEAIAKDDFDLDEGGVIKEEIKGK